MAKKKARVSKAHAVPNNAVREITTRLDVYNKSLDDYLKRTVLLEVSLEAQRKYFEFRDSALEDRMDRAEVNMNSMPTKIIQYVSIVSGIIAALKLLL